MDELILLIISEKTKTNLRLTPTYVLIYGLIVSYTQSYQFNSQNNYSKNHHNPKHNINKLEKEHLDFFFFWLNKNIRILVAKWNTHK